MLQISKLLLWVWMVTNALAFFPEYPKWKCIEDGKCSANSSNFDGPIFSLRRMARTNDLPSSVQIAEYVASLTKKFEEVNLSHVKRANSFPIVTATPPTQTNSVALDQDGADFSYFAQVKLGASGKPLWMLMDTGASSTWVMGSTCSTAACISHDSFGANDSSTYQASQTPFSVGYGTGVVSGMYATDTMSLAGFTLSLTFGIANQTSNDFTHFPFDGIIGLSTFTGEVPTFLDVLMSSKVLKSNIIGVNIDRAADGEHNGEINFEQPDDSKYIGSLSYTPVSDPEGWKIAVDSVGFNGKSAGMTGRFAYIDTGTSYCFLPPDDAKALHRLIPGSQLSADGNTWYVPCTTTSPIQFMFSGVTYNVSTKDWIGGKINSLCASNIYPATPAGEVWLLGDTFLKNVYALFDVDQKRIGFGVKPTVLAASTSTSTPTPTATISMPGDSYDTTSALATAPTNPGSSEGFNGVVSSYSASSTSVRQSRPAASTTSTSCCATYEANIIFTAFFFLATLGRMI